MAISSFELLGTHNLHGHGSRALMDFESWLGPPSVMVRLVEDASQGSTWERSSGSIGETPCSCVSTTQGTIYIQGQSVTRPPQPFSSERGSPLTDNTGVGQSGGLDQCLSSCHYIKRTTNSKNRLSTEENREDIVTLDPYLAK